MTSTNNSIQSRIQEIGNIPIEERREKAQTHFIVRRNADTGHTLSFEEAKIKTRSYESHLTRLGIHPDEYKAVYEKAVELYNPYRQVGPFGIDYVIAAAKALRAPTPTPRREKKVYICDKCKDTGYELKGLIPVTVEIEGVKTKLNCKECS